MNEDKSSKEVRCAIEIDTGQLSPATADNKIVGPFVLGNRCCGSHSQRPAVGDWRKSVHNASPMPWSSVGKARIMVAGAVVWDSLERAGLAVSGAKVVCAAAQR